MNLIERIACSQGNPDRARVAMDLIYAQRLQMYGQVTAQVKTHRNFVCLNRLNNSEAKPEDEASAAS